MRVNILFRLFSVCNLLLDTISAFESQILFYLSLKFALLYGNAILNQCKNVPKNASKEKFTSKQLYRSFQTSLLRKIFVPKRMEQTGDWRKLHNEELRDFFSLPNIICVMNVKFVNVFIV